MLWYGESYTSHLNFRITGTSDQLFLSYNPKAGNLIVRIPAICMCYFVKKSILLQKLIMDYQADLDCFLDYYPD